MAPTKPKAVPAKNHDIISPQQQLLDQLEKKKIEEFNDAWKKLAREKEELPCTAWEHYKNSPKNRYAEIPCNDYNLVAVPGCQFFNGNFIKDDNGKKMFVAGQGPTAESTEDFWRVVINEKIQVVVMLCKLIEADRDSKKFVPKEKCHQYWPTADAFYFDKFYVQQAGTERLEFAGGREVVIVTSLQIINSKTKKVIKQVEHVQMLAWPDFGIPPTTEAAMAVITNYVKPSVESNHPVFVHCSAGIGRTGAFVGTFYCYDLFKKNKLVSVESGIKQLRRMRAKSVQTPDQYIFMQLLMINLLKADAIAAKRATTQLNLIAEKFQDLLKLLKARAEKKAKKAKTQ